VHGAPSLLQVDCSFDDCLDAGQEAPPEYPVGPWVKLGQTPTGLQGQNTAAVRDRGPSFRRPRPTVHMPAGRQPAGNIAAYWMGYTLLPGRPRLAGDRAPRNVSASSPRRGRPIFDLAKPGASATDDRPPRSGSATRRPRGRCWPRRSETIRAGSSIGPPTGRCPSGLPTGFGCWPPRRRRSLRRNSPPRPGGRPAPVQRAGWPDPRPDPGWVCRITGETPLRTP